MGTVYPPSVVVFFFFCFVFLMAVWLNLEILFIQSQRSGAKKPNLIDMKSVILNSCMNLTRALFGVFVYRFFPSVYFLLFVSSGGFVEKQVDVCSGCTLSDPNEFNPKAESWKSKSLPPPRGSSIHKAHSGKRKISFWYNRKWAG